MKKIKTIFERDWNGNRGVINKPVVFLPTNKNVIKATEKLDGTNVRLTIRSGQVVRVEKRRNPNKRQKQLKISEPWYVDADEFSPADKYIFEAVTNRNYVGIPDGEWSGEAVGLKIQGNPLKLEDHRVILFSCGEAPVFDDVPTTFNELKEWLTDRRSLVNPEAFIEGIVWHVNNGNMYKIKTKDFK